MQNNDTLYYFIENEPTQSDIEKATKLTKKVQFVDVHNFDVNIDNPVIKFVAGVVPDSYANRVVLDQIKTDLKKSKQND